METNTVLRDGSTDLTASATLTPIRVGPMTKPLWLHVLVPELNATETVDVELEFTDAADPTTEVYNMNMKQIAAAGFFSIPFYTKETHLQVKLVVSAGGDAGATKIWIDPAHRAKGAINK